MGLPLVGGSAARAATDASASSYVTATLNIPYRTVDAQTLLVDEYGPADATDAPAIMLIHGGAFKIGDRAGMALEAEELAAAGFVAFTVDYRLAPPGGGAHYPDPIDDVRAAMEWIRANAPRYGADPTRVGALGSSSGASLALTLATTGIPGADRPEAVVSWSAPTAFALDPNPSSVPYAAEANYIGCDLTVCPDLWQAASPETYVTAEASPAQLVNSADEMIPLVQATSMDEAYRNAGAADELIVLDGDLHAQAYGDQVWSRALTFLERYLMDADPPSVTIAGGPGPVTNATTATFDVTVDDPAATVTCSLDGGDPRPCGPAYTIDGLGAGGHSLLAIAVDGSKNVGEARHGWIVDAAAPALAIASGPDGATGATDATFVFSSDDAAATTTCSLDGAPADPCASPADYPGLTEGSHWFEVTATDPAGNTATADRSWTVDPAAAALTLSGGPPAYSSAPDATFEISAGDGAQLACAVDGSELAPCSTSVLLTSLADGAHDLDVTATDQAGNTASAAWAWRVDTASPTLDIQSPPPDPSTSGDATIAFGADEPVAEFTCSVDGGPAATCSSPVSMSGLADGTHSFVVSGADAAGNAGEVTTSWTVQTPPSVDLSLAVAVTRWPARTDQVTSYSVTVTNEGFDAAGGVVVAATLTSNERWISSEMEGAACVATSCTLPSLPAGSSARALLTMLPTEPVTNSDVFTVSSDDPDPTPADDAVTLVLPIVPGPGSASVFIPDAGLPTSSVNVDPGGGVLWTVDPTDAAPHSVADASGLRLFDSGMLQPGGTLWVRLFAAGTYMAKDSTTSTKQPVRVGMRAQPLGAGAFRITWASQPAPDGFAYDVQVRLPGSAVWTKLQTATQPPSMTYTTAGSGTYGFRARLRATAGQFSGWSSPMSIKT